jgi:hypothetical protein
MEWMQPQAPQPRPLLKKCQSQKVCDALIRSGWTLRTEFRAKPGDEPYEYVLEWTKPEPPPPNQKASNLGNYILGNSDGQAPRFA